MNDANALSDGEKHTGVTGDGASRLATHDEFGKDALKWPETYRLVRMQVSDNLKIVLRRPRLVTFPVQGPGKTVYITREVPIR